MIGVAFISDRGDRYMPDCLRSFRSHVGFRQVDRAFVVDDSNHALGMAGAVRTAWQWATDNEFTHLLHVEEDFRFNEAVDVAAMAAILDANPRLAQVVLKRQPWSLEEHVAGGIIECHPDEYIDRDGFVEHTRIFSLNPCLIPRRVFTLGWDDDNEAGFTRRCVDAGMSFAFFGRRDDPPRVTHVGAVRSHGWRL